MNTCLLCTYKESCEQDSLVLYPTTPIGKDLLIQALQQSGIGYTVDRDLICLHKTTDDKELKSALQTRLTEFEMRDIRVTRSRGLEMMNASDVLSWMKHSDTSWFDEALVADKFTTYFQPIVDYSTGTIYGHECLVRLFLERSYNGGEIMDAAVARGRLHVFDSYLRQLSVRLAGRQHVPGTKVFVNFMPSAIYDPAFCMKSTLEAMSHTDLQPDDVVFEVVESEAITDVKHLKKICAYYRDHGFRFALDDVGTGSNSLQMACDLHPHYLKIDKSLVVNVDQPMYRATIQKMVELGQEFDIRVIAEGIETREAAATCLELGIHLMQGYHFARPQAEMVSTATDLIHLARPVQQNTPSQLCLQAPQLLILR